MMAGMVQLIQLLFVMVDTNDGPALDSNVYIFWIGYNGIEGVIDSIFHGIWMEYEQTMSLNFANHVVSMLISNHPRGSVEVLHPARPGASKESRKRLWKMQWEVALYLGSQCWPLIHMIHTLLEGHLTMMTNDVLVPNFFLFSSCSSLCCIFGTWILRSIRLIHLSDRLFHCWIFAAWQCGSARSSFLQVLEPFGAQCGRHWLENCYSRGKDWWESDEVVPLPGGVASGKQPDSWCSQYKWQICMHR